MCPARRWAATRRARVGVDLRSDAGAPELLTQGLDLGQLAACQRAEGDLDETGHVVAALLHVEDLDQGAEQLAHPDVPVGEPLAEVERGRVAVDEGAVEVEERADLRTLGPPGHLGHQVVDVAHATPPSRRLCSATVLSPLSAMPRITPTARTASASSTANSSRALRRSSPPGPSSPRLPASLTAPFIRSFEIDSGLCSCCWSQRWRATPRHSPIRASVSTGAAGSRVANRSATTW